jgi:hypothetical protein
MAAREVNSIIAMAFSEAPTIGDMAAAKGGIPLKYREHAVATARREILALEAKGLTQGQIGELWGGLSQSTISDLKGGKVSKLGVRVLLCIRQGLRMPLDELLGLPPLRDDNGTSPRRMHR